MKKCKKKKNIPCCRQNCNLLLDLNAVWEQKKNNNN